MGIYVNPGNESFSSAIRSEIYVDKTGLLRELNRAIRTEFRYFAVSRARRFGKSMAAGMIDAYYSRGCDSRELFEPYEIARDPDFDTHLNKYNVLHFDASTYFNQAENWTDMKQQLDRALLRDLCKEFPYLRDEHLTTAVEALQIVYAETGIPFVVIVDEWECIIRDAKNDPEWIIGWLKYLRGFFKTEESKRFLALGYITGILPIKKIEGESAMNVFEEYTMTTPQNLAPYFGFTETEVEELCASYQMDIAEIRRWYDGYHMRYLPKDKTHQMLHMYNPNSLACALMHHEIDNYWKNTGAFRQLNDYIERDEAGLRETVLQLLAGEPCQVNIKTFQNDLTSYRSRDDVLTALIHMGYLGYEPETGCAFIPNEEVRAVFDSAIAVGDWTEVRDAIHRSDELLLATWDGDTEKVSSAIAASHQDCASILTYHDENSLACAIQIAYYTARAHYVTVRELPTGKGFADIAFIPRHHSGKPAMIVELKWNHDAETAISQIHARNYAGKLSDFNGELLLVGISYTQKEKTYQCVIERKNS